jgi:hypothetical protein
MSDEQSNLKNPKPICVFCQGNEDQVIRLVKVHEKYLCSTCCKRIKKLMDKGINADPPEAA